MAIAMVLYVKEGLMRAHNTRLGNIDIRFNGDDNSYYEASLRGDMVEFHTIHRKEKKYKTETDQDVFIIGSTNAWEEHIFVRNVTLENQEKSFFEKLKELNAKKR